MTGRDLPISFSGPMVKALLAGTKTQTRRGLPMRYSVYDRLYVREHWRADSCLDKIAPRDMPTDLNNRPHVQYEADGPGPGFGILEAGRFRQGMHMPRWASRLTLTVTEVRVERLQDITEADAIAEGIEYELQTSAGRFYRNYQNPPCPIMAYGSYRSLWETINGPGSWDANPWVVAYTFTVAMGNIDQLARAA